MKETVRRVDRIVCNEKGKVYSKTIVLLNKNSRVEFIDSEHLDWVNLRPGDTVDCRYDYPYQPRIMRVEYALDDLDA